MKVVTAFDGVQCVQFKYEGYEVSIRLDPKKPETVILDSNNHIIQEWYTADGDAICAAMSWIDAFGD